MKTLLVIPSKGQTQYLPELVAHIEKLAAKPTDIWIYLDRPTGRERVETMRYLKDHPSITLKVNTGMPEYVGHPQMNAGEEYFLAGHVRNIAIEYAYANEYDSVIFIDGDCMPEPDLISGHNELLDADTPRITIGKRKEIKWGLDDQRVASPSSLIRIFGPNGGKRITSEFYFVDSGVVWTCNFGINRKGIERLYEMNTQLYGRREVFSSEFSGTWGGEDGFLGLECLYGNIGVYSLKDGTNGIIHKEHERPVRKYDHITFIDYMEFRREELLARMNSFGMEVPPFVPRLELIQQFSRMRAP